MDGRPSRRNKAAFSNFCGRIALYTPFDTHRLCTADHMYSLCLFQNTLRFLEDDFKDGYTNSPPSLRSTFIEGCSRGTLCYFGHIQN